MVKDIKLNISPKITFKPVLANTNNLFSLSYPMRSVCYSRDWSLCHLRMWPDTGGVPGLRDTPWPNAESSTLDVHGQPTAVLCGNLCKCRANLQCMSCESCLFCTQAETLSRCVNNISQISAITAQIQHLSQSGTLQGQSVTSHFILILFH